MIHTSQGVHSSVPGLVKAGGQLGIPGRPNHRALVVSRVSGEASRQVQWQAMHSAKMLLSHQECHGTKCWPVRCQQKCLMYLLAQILKGS